jgi:hydroxymethylbilane synthase
MARWQTDHVIALVHGTSAGGEGGAGAALEPLVVSTVADRRLDLSITQLGGKGAFAREVQAALLDGRADLAVHSGKDLPSATPDGLVVAAVLARHDPRDAVVGARLADLPPGARVGTGSPRRRAQLAWLRPDLTFADVRGNVGTRLAKLDRGDVDALVLALAGLQRLGLDGERPLDVLGADVMVPQVAQGTLAVECRADDDATRELLAPLDDAPTRLVFRAERAFLAALGGDCYLPAGAYARLGAGGRLELEALIASPDGHVVLRHRVQGDPDGDAPEALGAEAAAFLLDAAGGRQLLEG